MNKDSDKNLLYHELPSIEPRVSRHERISLNKRCYDCEPPYLKNAKQKSKYLYIFYIAILAIGIVISSLYNKNNQNTLKVTEHTKTIKTSLFRNIYATLIQSNNRHGLSILFRNKESKYWKIDYITISLSNTNIVENLPINKILKKQGFYSLFVPLPTEYKIIDDIIISTTPQ